MKFLILLIILLIILTITLLYLYVTNYESFYQANVQNYNNLKIVDPDIIKQLYQMMYDVDKLFTENKIQYWITGGTLLGAIRHSGIIPWDDDLDIEILDIDGNNIINLKNKLEEMGYEIHTAWFGYKICPKNGKKINGFKWKYPGLDIFVMKIDENNQIDYIHKHPKNFFPHCKFTMTELFPIKKYKFANFFVNGPNDGKGYLDRCYGNDWASVGYREYDHQNEHAIQKIKVILTDENKKPAMPFITLN